MDRETVEKAILVAIEWYREQVAEIEGKIVSLKSMLEGDKEPVPVVVASRKKRGRPARVARPGLGRRKP